MSTKLIEPACILLRKTQSLPNSQRLAQHVSASTWHLSRSIHGQLCLMNRSMCPEIHRGLRIQSSRIKQLSSRYSENLIRVLGIAVEVHSQSQGEGSLLSQFLRLWKHPLFLSQASCFVLGACDQPALHCASPSVSGLLALRLYTIISLFTSILVATGMEEKIQETKGSHSQQSLLVLAARDKPQGPHQTLFVSLIGVYGSARKRICT